MRPYALACAMAFSVLLFMAGDTFLKQQTTEDDRINQEVNAVTLIQFYVVWHARYCACGWDRPEERRTATRYSRTRRA